MDYSWAREKVYWRQKDETIPKMMAFGLVQRWAIATMLVTKKELQ